MAKVEDGGQAGFEDKPLSVPPDVLEAIESYLENKAAATDFSKARTAIKEAVPEVEKPTRFVIAERYIILATPYETDGHEVGGGRHQRLKIETGP